MEIEQKPSQKTKVDLSDALDRLVLRIGRSLAWANGVLIAVIVLQVVLRYGFGHGLVVLEELQWHLYALAFMFGLAYALVTDSHVRVDLIYSRLPVRVRHWIEILGTLLLLLPFIAVILYYGLEFFHASWIHNERSLAPLGLPWRWAIKAVIPLSFLLLALAAVSRLWRTMVLLRRRNDGDS
jgi:TRAP-type mannitol/chloroaromatic compound transport system permease small subunit